MKQPYKLLKAAFDRQKKINRGLSLRSLAVKVQVSPGFLSKVLSGKKGLTPQLIEKLCFQLRVDSLQKDQILLYLEENILRDKLGKSKRSSNRAARSVPVLQEMTLMTEDAEWLLAKWYRLPLLDLTTCHDFKNDIAWIAQRLAISELEAQEAMNKLEKYGFLTRTSDGKVTKTHSTLRFPSKFSKSSIRDYHTLQMKRAIELMNRDTSQVGFDKRLVTGLSVASNPQGIEKAKAILHRALYEAAEVLHEGECTQVYQINIQLFPHTR